MPSITSANDRKLDLASEFGLQAKFDYQGKSDAAPRERRIVVDDYDGEYVFGTSYDNNGFDEGYRQFSVANIVGQVSIR